MEFNEDSRVKIPAILHLCRLGYQYLPLKQARWDERTNLFPDLFRVGVTAINPDISADEIDRLRGEISLLLDNEDLGQAFFERLTEHSGLRLIDFANFNRNHFHVVTELTYKNGEEEFRPDITLLINGMPLAFIEVKKPNNPDGIQAERKRIETRCQNRKFRRFLNLTQLMVFSNNMEYDPHAIQPIQGAFYAAASYHKPIFNYFREEEALNLSALLRPLDGELENLVLRDNNLAVIKASPEFQTNKDPDSPTNRILTSLFCRERFAFLLNYALTYVKESEGLEKHVMRYPQLFATKAVERSLSQGIRKGIIWHTQGSGKTALAFFLVRFLTDYFQRQGIVPKFYFIVDRLDLLKQAQREFNARDLIVHTVDSREQFIRDIQIRSALHNDAGRAEITVVNIQKFSDDAQVLTRQAYDVRLQRIYFLDEVHRSYNPTGSFLANLNESDPNSIKIGLTGTPLIGDLRSRDLFGDYIHKYYYNASIADGFTLRLIREEIETRYKMQLQEVLKEIEILKGDLDKRAVYAHPRFVEPMLAYIIEDFEKSRRTLNDASIGGMVVCDSAEQAREMYELFQKKYASTTSFVQAATREYAIAAEAPAPYEVKRRPEYLVQRAQLILHDVGAKEDRDQWVRDFKDGRIDFLFVYNMLLTGFDAKRLKKLYLGRVIRRHNLLQTLTRVNRTYKDFPYGYVVDFADIRKEFDATNKAYFDELQAELGDEMTHYADLFKTQEEIVAEIEEIKEVLFAFDTLNMEVFSRQITEISDVKEMQRMVRVLGNARSLYNLIRLMGHYELLEQIDFRQLNYLYHEASNHLAMIHQKEALENEADTSNLLNTALEDIVFLFTKIGEEELILADQLKETLRKTREELQANFDKKDPEFVSLYEELQRLFKGKQLGEVSQDEKKANIGALRGIQERVRDLNRRNNLLKAKYQQDAKYARVHKRLRERQNRLTERESQLFQALESVKQEADEAVLNNQAMIANEDYFERMVQRLVIAQFKNTHKIPLDVQAAREIKQLIVREYLNEYHGR